MLADSVLHLTPEQRIELGGLLDELERRRRTRMLETMFPDAGPLRRALYPRHVEFFELGATCSERVFMAGNRVGKTMAAGTELAYHLTGRYPWWCAPLHSRAPVSSTALACSLAAFDESVGGEGRIYNRGPEPRRRWGPRGGGRRRLRAQSRGPW